jgi:methionyl aminopeptidase
MTTDDLNRIAEEEILRHPGCTPAFKGYNGFPAALCTSINNEVVHGIPSEKRELKEGDIVGCDCGVTYRGMITDACRTFLVGGAKNPAVPHFLKTTQKALSNALKQVRGGARVGDISAVIGKTLRDQGYEPVIECTGHGVGHELHEPPEILNDGVSGKGPVLSAGMVLAIEPISAMGSGKIRTAPDGWTVLTADDSLSAHFEHTVLVTDDGFEILT